MSSSDLLLDIRGLKKRFGGQPALAGVDFELRRGEIHALLGENGAGKSTLIKILAGVVEPDDGEILFPSEERREGVPGPRLAFVHQDLGLIDMLSVAENIALEVGYRRRGGLISHRRTEVEVQSALSRVGTDISPRTLVADLSQHEKVLVALARALTLDAEIIVFDEVSSSLPKPEVDRLMEPLRSSLESGVGYVYVTHRLNEVFDLADRVTVLRDGKRVATAEVDGINHEQLVDMIVGRDLGSESAPVRSESARSGSPRLVVAGLSGPGLAAPVDLQIAEGEILGVCGLVGSGARELAQLVAGAAAADSGSVVLDGAELPLGSRQRLSQLGCEYVAGDRLKEGAMLGMSIRENFFPTYRPGGAAEDRMIRWPSRERTSAQRLIGNYGVRPSGSAEQALLTLSGGNQQKVALGRALRTKPRLLVLDDPTAGVDVGSRYDLHALLRTAAEEGAVVLLASTDFEEIAHVADRALVMCEGAVSVEFKGSLISEDRLAEASYGAADSSQAKGE